MVDTPEFMTDPAGQSTLQADALKFSQDLEDEQSKTALVDDSSPTLS